MADLSTAQQMVDYYKHMPARIRNHLIHVQFSMHERLKVSWVIISTIYELLLVLTVAKSIILLQQPIFIGNCNDGN